MKQSYIVTAVIAVVVGGIAFYGGMQYQLKKTPAMAQFGNRMMGQGAGQAQGGQGRGNFQGRMNGQGMQPINGEVISVDDTSMTVKLQDGSSKIIILSEKTAFNKTSEGLKTDIKTGGHVTAFGSANTDGSVTAQNVSIGGGMFRSGMPGGRPDQGEASSSPTPKQ